MSSSPPPAAIVVPIIIVFTFAVITAIARCINDSNQKADLEAQQRRQKEDADAKWSSLIQAIQTAPRDNDSGQKSNANVEVINSAGGVDELNKQERSLHELYNLNPAAPVTSFPVAPSEKHKVGPVEVVKIYTNPKESALTEIDSKPLPDIGQASHFHNADIRSTLRASPSGMRDDNLYRNTESKHSVQQSDEPFSAYAARRSSKMSHGGSEDLFDEADIAVQELGLIGVRKRQLASSAERHGVTPEAVEGRKGEEYRDLLRREIRIRARLEEIARTGGDTFH